MRKLHDSSPLSVVFFFITIVIAMAALGVTSQAAEAGFARAVLYSPGGSGAGSLAMGDLNGDGYPDLAVTTGCPGYGCVGVLSGNGDGTFQPAVTYNSGLYAAGSVAIADVNEDGKMDLVVTGGGMLCLVCERAAGQRRRHLPGPRYLRIWRIRSRFGCSRGRER